MRPAAVGALLVLVGVSMAAVADAAAADLSAMALQEEMRQTRAALTAKYAQLAQVRLARAREEAARGEAFKRLSELAVELVDEGESQDPGAQITPGGDAAAEAPSPPKDGGQEDPKEQLEDLEHKSADMDKQVLALQANLDQAEFKMKQSAELNKGFNAHAKLPPTFPDGTDLCKGEAALQLVHYYLLRGTIAWHGYTREALKCLSGSAGPRGVWATVAPACDALGEEERAEKKNQRELDHKAKEAQQKKQERDDKESKLKSEKAEKAEIIAKGTEKDQKRIWRLQIGTGDVITLQSKATEQYFGVESDEGDQDKVRWAHTNSKRTWIEVVGPSSNFTPGVTVGLKSMFNAKFVRLQGGTDLFSKGNDPNAASTKFMLDKIEDNSHNYSHIDPNPYLLNGDTVAIRAEGNKKYLAVDKDDVSATIDAKGIQKVLFKLVRKYRAGDPTDGSGCFFDDLTPVPEAATSVGGPPKAVKYAGTNGHPNCDLDGVTRTGEGCIISRKGWDCPGTTDGKETPGTALMCHEGYWSLGKTKSRAPTCSESGCFVSDLDIWEGASYHGCPNKPGFKLPHGGKCHFEKPGWNCVQPTCHYGKWATVPRPVASTFTNGIEGAVPRSSKDAICKEKPCEYSWLSKPPNNFGATRSGCKDGTNEHGTVCKWEMPGYECEESKCNYGSWTNSKPTCKPIKCKFNELTVHSGAVANEGGRCRQGGLSPSSLFTVPQRTCRAHGHRCDGNLLSNGGCCAPYKCYEYNHHHHVCKKKCPRDNRWKCHRERRKSREQAWNETERTCTFQKRGWDCDSLKCELSGWVNEGGARVDGERTDATQVMCTEARCKFSALRLPGGATADGAGCEAGGETMHGQSCTIAKGGHDCENVSCSLGRWSTNRPKCSPKPCPFDSLEAPEEAAAGPFRPGGLVGPDNQVVQGFCTNWQQTSGGPTNGTAQLCWAQCAANEACEQAVFEIGPTGPMCWHGSGTMDKYPDGNRDCSALGGECHDLCYNKRGFGFTKNCDWRCYKDRYPDVSAQIGSGGDILKKAKEHFKAIGVKAGKDCSCPPDNSLKCEAGKKVAHGTKCSIKRDNHECTTPKCEYGEFVPGKDKLTCTPDGCDYNLLVPFKNTTVSGENCEMTITPQVFPGQTVVLKDPSNGRWCRVIKNHHAQVLCDRTNYESNRYHDHTTKFYVETGTSKVPGSFTLRSQWGRRYCLHTDDGLKCTNIHGRGRYFLAEEDGDKVTFNRADGASTAYSKSFTVKCIDKCEAPAVKKVPSGKECAFERPGFTCESAKCTEGSFSTTYPNCEAKKCAFDDLILPTDPLVSVVGLGCASGGMVKNGSECTVTKPGFFCPSPKCEYGAFDITAPTCGPMPCKVEDLSLPTGAKLKGGECNSGNGVADGVKCEIDHDGFECPAVTCSLGIWSASTPNCTVKHCEFDAVSWPSNATIGGDDNCKTGGTVPNGTSCTVEVEGKDCNGPVMCQFGVITPDPVCGAAGCSFANVTVPQGASVSGSGCNSGDIKVPGGKSCTITREGYDCQSPKCTAGKFDVYTPTCKLSSVKTQAQILNIKFKNDPDPWFKMPAGDASNLVASNTGTASSTTFQFTLLTKSGESGVDVKVGDQVAIFSKGQGKWLKQTDSGTFENGADGDGKTWPTDVESHFYIETSAGATGSAVGFSSTVFLRSAKTGEYVGRNQLQMMGVACAVDDLVGHLWCQENSLFSSFGAAVESKTVQSFEECTELCGRGYDTTSGNEKCRVANYKAGDKTCSLYEAAAAGTAGGNVSETGFGCFKIQADSLPADCASGVEKDGGSVCDISMSGNTVPLHCCGGWEEDSTKCKNPADAETAAQIKAVNKIRSSWNEITLHKVESDATSAIMLLDEESSDEDDSLLADLML